MTTGEVVISKNSMKDKRHIISYPNDNPHGHIIVPLKSGGKITGVLCLFIEPDIEITENQIKVISSIGNSIGIALNNAKLYEETKAYSLHDPLTGLANRRFVD